VFEMKIGVVGLGSMGYGIAASLLRAGHQVHGADVNPDAVKRLRADGGAQSDAATAAAELDALVVVVLNATQVEEVLFGRKGLFPNLPSRAVVILCVTVSPDYARSVGKRCDERYIEFLDAPISGGSVKAAQGKLSVMASGTPSAFKKARPALDAMAETVFELGDSAGAGSAMKAVNQMLAGVHIAAMAEALTFGMTQGVTPEAFMKVIPKCAGTSWMLENRAPHIVAGDYTPHSAVDIWPKDLGIVLDAARC
jgi:L-threonate 2-dehydrogenase